MSAKELLHTLHVANDKCNKKAKRRNRVMLTSVVNLRQSRITWEINLGKGLVRLHGHAVREYLNQVA